MMYSFIEPLTQDRIIYVSIQQDINMFQTWADTWLMTFNPTKCELIHVGHKSSPGFIVITSKTIQLKQLHM